ncbi:serine hydrolase domain-containing protein [Poriferisphaera sp. WC338]|uniref:serine hydrolase domain-containing protein n=1 Tax=Poriferisphaera sp. WC338 TaxID=3425129 RepID=UPI003D81272C
MTSRIVFMLLTVTLLFPLAAFSMKQTTSPHLKSLDDAVISGIKKKLYPGAVLVVGRDDKILHAKSYGRHTFSNRSQPVKLNSIFDMASCSKLVGTTSASLLNLQDKTFTLKTPVYKLISGFEQQDKQNITIKDLLTHVSGLKAYENYKTADKKRTPDQSTADALISQYASLKKSYPTGTKCVYSCLNFQLMARVNENANQTRLEGFLIQRMFNPLAMNDTRYVLTDKQLKRTLPTHRSKAGKPIVGVIHDPLAKYHSSSTNCPGNAGLFSTAPDLASWCRMILDGGIYNGQTILDPKIVKQATLRQTPLKTGDSRGLGFDIWEAKGYIPPNYKSKPGKHIVGHSGYTGTLLWLDQNTGTYIIFLTNRTYPAEKDKTQQTPSIAPVRRKICITVLKSLPEYAKLYEK